MRSLRSISSQHSASFRGLLCLALVTACTSLASAQVSKGGSPLSENLRSIGDAPVVTLGYIDLATYIAEDALAGKDESYRFGAPVSVDLGIQNSGSWQEVDGGRLWRLQIHSDGAFSMNCQFDQFYLPAGAKLFAYNSDRSMTIGAFTKSNNKANGEFAIQPVAGDTIILELFEPDKYRGESQLHVNTVVHDYRDFYNLASRSFGDSGSCNNDVACAVSAGWENQIRSVGMLLSGGFRYCSGAMINNTADDGRQLFLSANHCSPGANDIVMFNYQSPSCGGGDGPTGQTAQGLTLLSNASPSDYWLVEVVESIPTSYNVYLAGFDATGAVPSSAVGIHHPSGDVKKISFDNDPTGISGYFGAGSDHWHIFDWEDGTTEGGSSGSPLFSNAGLIIGQLHGGTASCSNNIDDYYGRLSVSWSAGANAILSPSGGANMVVGRDLDGGGGTGPVNDTCASPTSIGDGVTAFDTTPATATVTMPCASGGGPDLWYSYSSICGGDVTLSTCNDASYDTAIAVWSDCGTTNVACNDDFSGCSNNTSQLTFNAAAGTTYFIQVAGFNGDSGTGNLTVSSTAVPNDSCAGAIPVIAGDTAYNTECATQTVTISCASGGGPDLWYSYTAPQDGLLEFNTCSDETYDTALALWDACGGTELECNDDDCSLRSRVSTTMTAGQSVIVQVTGYNGNSGAGVLTTLFTPSGSNPDDCVNAPEAFEGDTAFTNVGATTDGPDEPGACTAFGYTNIDSDIWYYWTATASGTATVSLCGSSYDTKMAIYENSCPSDESAIACNDDTCDLQSEVAFEASSGTTYYIRIGGYNGAQGAGTMNISLAGVACEDYTPLAVNSLDIGVSGLDIALTWDHVTMSVAGCDLPGVLYTVYATDELGNTSTVGTTVNNSFVHSNANMDDTVLTYRVTGTEVLARSARTNTVEDGNSQRIKFVPEVPVKKTAR